MDQLRAIGDFWNKLVDQSTYPSVFRRLEWLGPWWTVFGERASLWAFLVFDQNELVAALPMYQGVPKLHERCLGPRLRLVGVGGPTCPEYLGVIVSTANSDSALNTLAHHLESTRNQFSEIEFADVAADDIHTMALAEKLGQKFRQLTIHGDANPYLILAKTREEFWQNIPGDKRKRKLYQVRRVEKKYGAQMECVSQPDQFDSAFATIRDLSTLSHSRHDRKSPFANSDYSNFHVQSAKLLARVGLARCYFLRFAGTPVAFVYGYAYARKFLSFQTGFDPQFGKFSPGDVLHQMIFQQLIDEGYAEFDYLRGNESYKYSLGAHERITNTHRLFTGFMKALAGGLMARYTRMRRNYSARKRSNSQ